MRLPAEASDALARIDACQARGEADACRQALHALHAGAGDHPALLQALGLRYTALGLHEQAEACYARAVHLAPADPDALYNHAIALLAQGQVDEAEAALDQAIRLAPQDGSAWYNRSTLRRQTPERNHVDALRLALPRLASADPERIPLQYALAKELEDLGEHAAAFAALREGADARRRRLRYRVEDDLETMRLIETVFDGDFFQQPPVEGHPDARPLFVVGLPRSGTTLVDRILSSHSTITSRGESSDLAQALTRIAGPARDKADLVRRAARLDFQALGRAYCGTLAPGSSLRIVDKTPANFLYLALIAAALPQARIVHLRRNPMDACYAMYKTLFRMAYPFSYDLDDLGRYWLGYQRLMAHWRQWLPPDRFLELDYETLVTDQEAASRRLITHAGLPWDPACLSFEHNPQPTLTASAAQVRHPIHRASVGLWRHYAEELEPLRRRLAHAGVEVEA